MGYTTIFRGSFQFNTKVPEKIADYIKKFSRTRHMRRNVDQIKLMYPDWKDRCWAGFLGLEGEYFLDTEFDYCKNPSILDINAPPLTQPGLWCQWIISEDRKHLEWDGGEKFYNYKEWLEYLIKNFFAPSRLVLNGKVKWQGEDENDRGVLIVRSNSVSESFDNLFDF